MAQYFAGRSADTCYMPASPLTALRALVGSGVPDAEIAHPLQEGGSVEAGLDLYLKSTEQLRSKGIQQPATDPAVQNGSR